MSVRAPAEQRFRRARVKPGRRRGWRTVLTWARARRLAVAVLVAYAAYRSLALVAGAAALPVHRIEVRGNVRLSSGEILAIVEDLRGTNILRADLEAFRERLLDSPWIARVALRRVLPGTIEIDVSERQPFGLCRLRNELYLIDAEGTIIDQFGPQYAEFDLPIVDGLVRTPGPHPVIDAARAELAYRVVESLGAQDGLARRLSQIDVSHPGNAIVLLDGDPALLHLGDDRFLERLQSYLDLAPALRERVPQIDYVDLRFGARVYVRPAGRDGRTR
jgi:cell division septal protein FtsQ